MNAIVGFYDSYVKCAFMIYAIYHTITSLRGNSPILPLRFSLPAPNLTYQLADPP